MRVILRGNGVPFECLIIPKMYVRNDVKQNRHGKTTVRKKTKNKINSDSS